MPQTNETKEWTLMFYFASDNPLAPSIIPQLKSIKQAGYHPQVNVIAQFDPQPEGTPTHIFDVNLVNKLKGRRSDKDVEESGKPDDEKRLRRRGKQIGFSGFGPADPFVNNLIEDKLWNGESDRDGVKIRDRLIESLKMFEYNPPELPDFRKPAQPHPGGAETAEPAKATAVSNGNGAGHGSAEDEPNPRMSLSAFLKICAENYPARHYILFILGHGVVVANDIFLFDEHADQQSLSLRGLGDVLDEFKANVAKFAPGGQLELISFHSCSVSSVEVACQLEGKANYMLGSQGPAFVGSWPYRQILIRLFRNADTLAKIAAEGGSPEEVRREIIKALRKITDYCFHNSTDFLLAGYSFDVSLCDLNKVSDDLTNAISRLKDALCEGLDDEMLKNFILLAHLEAQSEWQENYTDLRDFCLCLRRQFRKFVEALGAATGDIVGGTLTKLEAIDQECATVAGMLEQPDRDAATSDEDDDAGLWGEIVVRSDFVGPEHQYSNGLSVYFPWVEPVGDRQILNDYQEYNFNKKTGWLVFLKAYFQKTQRLSRNAEDNNEVKVNGNGRRMQPLERKPDEELNEDMAKLVFAGETPLIGESGLALPVEKSNPNDRTGDGTSRSNIKNYPRDTRDLQTRLRSAPAEDAAGNNNVPTSQRKPFIK